MKFGPKISKMPFGFRRGRVHKMDATRKQSEAANCSRAVINVWLHNNEASQKEAEKRSKNELDAAYMRKCYLEPRSPK